MLHKLSTHIAQQLLANGVISDDDFELYEFSAFCFLFNLIPLGLSAYFFELSTIFLEKYPFHNPICINPDI
jgi:hypothetical protein